MTRKHFSRSRRTFVNGTFESAYERCSCHDDEPRFEDDHEAPASQREDVDEEVALGIGRVTAIEDYDEEEHSESTDEEHDPGVPCPRSDPETCVIPAYPVYFRRLAPNEERLSPLDDAEGAILHKIRHLLLSSSVMYSFCT